MTDAAAGVEEGSTGAGRERKGQDKADKETSMEPVFPQEAEPPTTLKDVGIDNE
jgi:hypothetical protein